MSWSITDRDTEDSADLEFMRDLEGIREDFLRLAEEMEEDIRSMYAKDWRNMDDSDIISLDYYIDEMTSIQKDMREMNRKLGFIS